MHLDRGIPKGANDKKATKVLLYALFADFSGMRPMVEAASPCAGAKVFSRKFFEKLSGLGECHEGNLSARIKTENDYATVRHT